MRRGGALLLAALLGGCGGGDDRVPVPGREGAFKTAAAVRADRRAYDGAPPVIPHPDFNANCTSCHTKVGLAIPDVGFAPPMPHGSTSGLSAFANCRQCHVFRKSGDAFRESGFAGLRQDLRRGRRLHGMAPPVMPHPVFMRENCTACHAGPAAREEIRCDHPERANCGQCHVPRRTTADFAR